MLNSSQPYTESMPLRHLIEDNKQLLMVICRFGISLGFGDKSVRDVCTADGVDVATFLAVCNFISRRPFEGYKISLTSLMGYLRTAHTYFIDFQLPLIRRKIIESINCSEQNDVSFLLIRFFDDYMSEVEHHMNHENTAVFSYVESLMNGSTERSFDIAEYSDGHESMSEKLNELKDIFIYHYHQKDNNQLTSALFDIINCEEDLISHCEVENRLFIPAVVELEERVCNSNDAPTCSADNSEEPDKVNVLSEREKDIIRCVAKGMANKEIADKLCLSIHTVTTYRRNLASKLSIHSPAGLTIFAIIHGLVNLDEVSNF